MRRLVNFVRNSKIHAWVVLFFEKFEMEGFTLSYSQGGEDLIIKKILSNKTKKGIYVDIGCNNPIQKSNTYKLYLKGWRGICVDGNSDLIKQFKKIRHRDIALCEIVSDQKREVTFYKAKNDHEFSTIDESTGQNILNDNRNVQTVKMVSKTLEELFDRYINNTPIDLLCVDVEQHDLQVLMGNNFSKYRPKIICAESPGDINAILDSPISKFLNSKGYKIKAFCGENIYYEDLQ